MIDTDRNYKKYLSYINKYINRTGVNEFIEWLETTDISTAPASTQYHLSEDGGLVQHSINVCKRLIQLIKMEYGTVDDSPYSVDTVAFVALFHDISKVNFYEKYSRNVKNQENGQWEQVFAYKVKNPNERITFGTSDENSVYILSKFFNLSDEEAVAIRWAEGYSRSNDSSTVALTFEVYEMSKLALLLHMANMMAICIDESSSSGVNGISMPECKECSVDNSDFDEQDSLKPTPETSDCPF